MSKAGNRIRVLSADFESDEFIASVMGVPCIGGGMSACQRDQDFEYANSWERDRAFIRARRAFKGSGITVEKLPWAAGGKE